MPSKVVDWLGKTLVSSLAPLLRTLGRNPAGYPATLRAADRAQVQIRSTSYYHPTYRDSDLPSDVTAPRRLPGIDLNEEAQLALVDRFDVRDELEMLRKSPTRHNGFRHGNGAYEYGDAETLYSMLRLLRPARLVEIGAGHSTRIAKTALDRNRAERPDLPVRHIAIEPYENDWLEDLGVQVVRERVQDLAENWFDQLEAGDMLFIDSSHVIRPFGDVTHLYQQLIPALPQGVIVHVHDIFTPHDYPEEWLRAGRRLWNEQYLLEAMLSHSPRYRVRLALNWLMRTHPERLHRALPAMAANPDHPPGAFWFEIVK